MDCAEEVEALKGTVGNLPDVTILGFNLLNGTMSIETSNTTPDALVLAAVRRAGLRAHALAKDQDTAGIQESFWERRGRLLTCIASASTLAAGIALCGWRCLLPGPAPVTPSIPGLACLLLSSILGMWHIVPKAAASASSLRPDMNLLMTIAILGALGLGDWVEAASASFLFAVSLWLESWSVSRSRHAIHAMTRLSPKTARHVDPHTGALSMRPVEAIAVGDAVAVFPGERIPLDGTVLKGAGSVNESPLTGESIPVAKAEGSDLFAGTINNESPLTLTVTKPSSDTMLARVIRMVEEAENRRAPVEQWVDRFARRYTPAMLFLAILVAIVPPLLWHADWMPWFNRALITLVIACPCALVISTPVGIIAGITAAARHGVLIKGGVHLETASRLQAMAIDKTGTLTCGTPSVQKVLAFNSHTKNEVLTLAAALESLSLHPFSRAILKEAAAANLPLPGVASYHNLPGRGATGWIDDRTYWIGSHRLLHEMNAETPDVHTLAVNLEDAGHSVVAIGAGNHVIGLISMADAVRPSAARMVDALRQAGIQRIVMLTGDNDGTASAVARQTGVDEYYAELLPDDKMRHLHQLVATHDTAGMVGDGVNDAPAMAASSLGMAMGAAGSDTAVESADVALMTDDLTKIPWLIAHSRRVMRTIRTNAAFAIGIKAAIMLLSLGGMATLWMAIAADTGATLVVVLWSLRLLRS